MYLFPTHATLEYSGNTLVVVLITSINDIGVVFYISFTFNSHILQENRINR